MIATDVKGGCHRVDPIWTLGHYDERRKWYRSLPSLHAERNADVANVHQRRRRASAARVMMTGSSMAVSRRINESM